MHTDLRFDPSSGLCINLVILFYIILYYIILYYAGPLVVSWDVIINYLRGSFISHLGEQISTLIGCVTLPLACVLTYITLIN